MGEGVKEDLGGGVAHFEKRINSSSFLGEKEKREREERKREKREKKREIEREREGGRRRRGAPCIKIPR